MKKTNFNALDFFLPFFAEHSYHTKAEKKYLKKIVYSNVEIGFVRLYFPKKKKPNQEKTILQSFQKTTKFIFTPHAREITLLATNIPPFQRYLPTYLSTSPLFGSYPSNEVIKNFYISDITSRTFIFFRFLFLVVVAVVVAQFGVIKKTVFYMFRKKVKF